MFDYSFGEKPCLLLICFSSVGCSVKITDSDFTNRLRQGCGPPRKPGRQFDRRKKGKPSTIPSNLPLFDNLVDEKYHIRRLFVDNCIAGKMAGPHPKVWLSDTASCPKTVSQKNWDKRSSKFCPKSLRKIVWDKKRIFHIIHHQKPVP